MNLLRIADRRFRICKSAIRNPQSAIRIMLVCLLQVNILSADDAVLTLPGEAKGAAMGNAYSPTAAGAEALWYNPAGLSLAETPTITVMHTAYLEDVTLNTAAVAFPFGSRNAIGIGASYLNVGSIPSYDNTGTASGGYSPKDLVARVGLSKAWSKTSLGVSAFLLQSTIVETASTFGLNAGIRQEWGPAVLALVGENFGGKLKYRTEKTALPQRLRTGASVNILSNLSFNAEVFKGKTGSPWFGTGLQYLYDVGGQFGVAVRGGYNTLSGSDIDGLHGVAAGLGLSFRGSALNYAWVPLGDLGQTHRVSFDVGFINPQQTVEQREPRTRPLIRGKKRESVSKATSRGINMAAASLPTLPWKKTSGWRTAKDKVMDLLARDALCTSTAARALITRTRGAVELKTDGEVRKTSRIRSGQYLFDGDVVRTYADAYAHMVFSNGVKAEVGPNTVMKVEAPIGDETQAMCERASVTLEKGQILAVADQGKSLDIKTTAGNKHVQGGEQLVSFDGKKLTAESPTQATRITDPDTRYTPGRWDQKFTQTFEREMMRLDSVPGLQLAEYVRDTARRSELKITLLNMMDREKGLRLQVNDLAEDAAGFEQLREALKLAVDGETRKARLSRRAGLRQATLSLNVTQKELRERQKELDALMKDVRKNREYLAAIPIVRMLNITAHESTIPFDKGSASVPPESTTVLDAIAAAMSQMKPFRVVVEGHTDKTGSARANERLSKLRAEAVAQYLRKKTGYTGRQFLTKGMGFAQPLEEGETPEIMAKNRRVEIWFELRGL